MKVFPYDHVCYICLKRAARLGQAAGRDELPTLTPADIQKFLFRGRSDLAGTVETQGYRAVCAGSRAASNVDRARGAACADFKRSVRAHIQYTRSRTATAD